ncbi:MAG TPA: hypothetical protein VFC01_20010 [Mycobacterium sp.]|nr:hypothetical protein [Mycobacterium sp.]
MEDPSTCGQGLSSRSPLPAKLGELLTALAQVLEAHMRALEPTDVNARKELDAYATLVTGHRDIADRLAAISEQMAGYRDLPMAPHNEASMSDTVAHKAFERFIRREQALAALLQDQLAQDEQMLRAMSGSPD